MGKAKILVIDDEPRIVQVVRLYLEKDGYQVLTAGDGKRALELAQKEKPDLIILDLMLPEIDGLEVCRQLRRGSDVPIIMLTARSEDADKLIGLELGADDYVTKPFSPREVVARVKTVLRRVATPTPKRQLNVSALLIDLDAHEVFCHGQKVELTNTEFKVLAALAEHPGKVLTRDQLLDAAQGVAYDGYDRTIDTHIKNLRQKLTGGGQEGNCRISTVHGVGYKLEANV